jgi:hypothetical protein
MQLDWRRLLFFCLVPTFAAIAVKCLVARCDYHMENRFIDGASKGNALAIGANWTKALLVMRTWNFDWNGINSWKNSARRITLPIRVATTLPASLQWSNYQVVCRPSQFTAATRRAYNLNNK